jgi:hypothetical protein
LKIIDRDRNERNPVSIYSDSIHSFLLANQDAEYIIQYIEKIKSSRKKWYFDFDSYLINIAIKYDNEKLFDYLVNKLNIVDGKKWIQEKFDSFIKNNKKIYGTNKTELLENLLPSPWEMILDFDQKYANKWADKLNKLKMPQYTLIYYDIIIENFNIDYKRNIAQHDDYLFETSPYTNTFIEKFCTLAFNKKLDINYFNNYLKIDKTKINNKLLGEIFEFNDFIFSRDIGNHEAFNILKKINKWVTEQAIILAQKNGKTFNINALINNITDKEQIDIILNQLPNEKIPITNIPCVEVISKIPKDKISFDIYQNKNCIFKKEMEEFNFDKIKFLFEIIKIAITLRSFQFWEAFFYSLENDDQINYADDDCERVIGLMRSGNLLNKDEQIYFFKLIDEQKNRTKYSIF